MRMSTKGKSSSTCDLKNCGMNGADKFIEKVYVTERRNQHPSTVRMSKLRD